MSVDGRMRLRRRDQKPNKGPPGPMGLDKTLAQQQTLCTSTVPGGERNENRAAKGLSLHGTTRTPRFLA